MSSNSMTVHKMVNYMTSGNLSIENTLSTLYCLSVVLFFLITHMSCTDECSGTAQNQNFITD